MKLFYEKNQDADPTINKREAGKEVAGGKICTHRCTDSFFKDTNEFSKSASGKERKRWSPSQQSVHYTFPLDVNHVYGSCVTFSTNKMSY